LKEFASEISTLHPSSSVTLKIARGFSNKKNITVIISNEVIQ